MLKEEQKSSLNIKSEKEEKKMTIGIILAILTMSVGFLAGEYIITIFIVFIGMLYTIIASKSDMFP